MKFPKSSSTAIFAVVMTVLQILQSLLINGPSDFLSLKNIIGIIVITAIATAIFAIPYRPKE